jgi:hypothetical protein
MIYCDFFQEHSDTPKYSRNWDVFGIFTRHLGKDKTGIKGRFSLARKCKSLNSMLLGDGGHECWEPGREALVSELLTKSLKEPIGLDQDFEEMHRLFRFTPDDVARIGVLSVAVSKNDLEMVERVRVLWPKMSGEMVLTHDILFLQKALRNSGQEILKQIMDWWGVEHIREIFRKPKLYHFPEFHFSVNNIDTETDPDSENDLSSSPRQYPRDWAAALGFLKAVDVHLSEILPHSHNLLLGVICQKLGSKAVAALQILRKWGMTVADVRGVNQVDLWLALSTAPEALSELATWGLGGNDVSHEKYKVLELASRKGNVEVLRVLAGRDYNLTTIHAQRNDNAALRSAARHGHVDVLNFLFDKYKLGNIDAQAINNEALRTAAKFGHVGVLEVLRNKFGLSQQDAQTSDNSALREAATWGHSEVLNTLSMTYNLTRDDARVFDNQALRAAAENGHAEVLKVLCEKFGLVAQDARTGNNEALRMAAKKGHVEVLMVLKTNFKLTGDDARTENNEALRRAAGNGHAEVLRVLHTHFGLTAEDARAKGNDALFDAVLNRRVNSLQALSKYYGMTASDARSNNNALLRKAAERGFSDVLEVLRKTYGLTTNDARAQHNEALRNAATYGQAGVLQILAQEFQLNAEDARANDNEAIGVGDHNVLKVLASNFKLTSKDARVGNNQKLQGALKAGNIAVLKVLHEDFGLGREDVLPHLNILFENLRKFEDAKACAVLQCLRDEYGLQRTDLFGSLDGKSLRLRFSSNWLKILRCW